MSRILLIVGGGIAAYKACEIVRGLKKRGHAVRCVLTEGGSHFVTAMTLAALSEAEVHTTLWDLKDEAEMGHIQLSREADLVVVAPATADLLARMAAGVADDLATTLLLATDKPVLAAPAMNVRMWLHPATRRNVATLTADGVEVMAPDEGAMACGEFGPGRLPEPEAILARIEQRLAGGTRGDEAVRVEPLTGQHVPSDPLAGRHVPSGPLAGRHVPSDPLAGRHVPPGPLAGRHVPPGPLAGRHVPPGPLAGRHVIVTAGPTHEPIDPVRYLANRSSGKQGFAIAAALAAAGARVTLIAGPVALPTPAGTTRVDVETARQMAAAVDAALPADAAVMVAAVADWRVDTASGQKIKKGVDTPALVLAENPDILATVARGPRRPALVVGFAAETEFVVDHARAKLARKGADWIVANDVSGDVMGGDANAVHLVTHDGIERWERAPKDEVARRLVARIESRFSGA